MMVKKAEPKTAQKKTPAKKKAAAPKAAAPKVAVPKVAAPKTKAVARKKTVSPSVAAKKVSKSEVKPEIKIVNGRMVRKARLPRQDSYTLRASEVNRQWWIVDARGLVLGRMAAVISSVLRGKTKPTYTPHMDGGDGVIVVNARAVALTGNKRAGKIYYRHTGYPGGLKEQQAGAILDGKHPERVVTLAVKRMLGRGPMARQRLSHLKVYGGETHPHEGLQPKSLDVAAMNKKNVRHGS